MKAYGECLSCGTPQVVCNEARYPDGTPVPVRCACGGELRVSSIEFKSGDERIDMLTQAVRTPGR